MAATPEAKNHNPGANEDSVLHKAAHSGGIVRLGLSLTNLDDVNLKSYRCFTLLELAIRGNQSEAMLAMLSNHDCEKGAED